MDTPDLRLSLHFKLSEFTASMTAVRHGVPVVILPGSHEWGNLQRLCEDVLEPLRTATGGPIRILSGYRPPELNRLVGGSPTSAHLKACAADLQVGDHAPYDLALWLSRSGLPFDQVILEFNRWVHVAVAEPNLRPRRQVRTAWRNRLGQVCYTPGVQILSEND
ncbi:MAG: peptidase M15A [Magnetococcales bacterium]|nr:peptidase M15A [Magnetococcales bacterium]